MKDMSNRFQVFRVQVVKYVPGQRPTTELAWAVYEIGHTPALLKGNFHLHVEKATQLCDAPNAGEPLPPPIAIAKQKSANVVIVAVTRLDSANKPIDRESPQYFTVSRDDESLVVVTGPHTSMEATKSAQLALPASSSVGPPSAPPVAPTPPRRDKWGRLIP